ncbi:Uncharacterised protein [Vibrio cholerae]|nr:Uncharacterised protein [Vibrio cholerae]
MFTSLNTGTTRPFGVSMNTSGVIFIPVSRFASIAFCS